MQRVLVVGGTGLIGSTVATELARRGYDVAVAGRNRPEEGAPAAAHRWVEGDYTSPGWTERLREFDALVFAAAQDIRHVGPHASAETWQDVQTASLPAFFAEARDAGVRRAVLVGSYYHQVLPDLVATNAYVRARAEAERGVLALATPEFAVCAVNPPNVVGVAPGRALHAFAKMVRWARGGLAAKVPDCAPHGGTNYISVHAVAAAVAGAVERGESGRAYLIGDENLSFQSYFQALFDAAGAGRTVAVCDDDHAFLPDDFLVAGKGVTIDYEPDAAERELLGYEGGDLAATLRAMVAAVDALPPRG
ncbi:NAD-dependent epimerase/dehydratase family protein [Nocardioides nitrophenolicus]|uniref:NAD-dependent epimerase/dehydratase family protein n=1 Tax=Nocardioides nitrophenolicus TaxID=60489 RepID=UPI00195DD963|nr:FAD-dependent oxidoreductase [Nocardioides nitrophenolicus]MBM7516832.1 nucleoside-diphosphate-sugar epimerase [Nocardioides nitrophenolicus]